jgi:hypothetical protein
LFQKNVTTEALRPRTPTIFCKTLAVKIRDFYTK